MVCIGSAKNHNYLLCPQEASNLGPVWIALVPTLSLRRCETGKLTSTIVQNLVCRSSLVLKLDQCRVRAAGCFCSDSALACLPLRPRLVTILDGTARRVCVFKVEPVVAVEIGEDIRVSVVL